MKYCIYASYEMTIQGTHARASSFLVPCIPYRSVFMGYGSSRAGLSLCTGVGIAVYIQDMVRDQKLPGGLQEKIKALTSRVAAVEEVVAFLLFGSAARDELKPLSDMDFAVLLSRNLSREGIEKLRLRLTGLIMEIMATEEFDLVILNTAPTRFSHAVMKEGVLLYIQDRNQLDEFREQNTSRYLDFLYYRREFDKFFLKRMGYHG